MFPLQKRHFSPVPLGLVLLALSVLIQHCAAEALFTDVFGNLFPKKQQPRPAYNLNNANSNSNSNSIYNNNNNNINNSPSTGGTTTGAAIYQWRPLYNTGAIPYYTPTTRPNSNLDKMKKFNWDIFNIFGYKVKGMSTAVQPNRPTYGAPIAKPTYKPLNPSQQTNFHQGGGFQASNKPTYNNNQQQTNFNYGQSSSSNGGGAFSKPNVVVAVPSNIQKKPIYNPAQNNQNNNNNNQWSNNGNTFNSNNQWSSNNGANSNLNQWNNNANTNQGGSTSTSFNNNQWSNNNGVNNQWNSNVNGISDGYGVPAAPVQPSYQPNNSNNNQRPPIPPNVRPNNNNNNQRPPIPPNVRPNNNNRPSYQPSNNGNNNRPSYQPNNVNSNRPSYQPNNNINNNRPNNNVNNKRPSYQPNNNRPSNNINNNRPSYQPNNNLNNNKPSYQPNNNNNKPSYQPNNGINNRPSYQPNNNRPNSNVNNNNRPSYQPNNSVNNNSPNYQPNINNNNNKPSFQPNVNVNNNRPNSNRPSHQPNNISNNRPANNANNIGNAILNTQTSHSSINNNNNRPTNNVNSNGNALLNTQTSYNGFNNNNNINLQNTIQSQNNNPTTLNPLPTYFPPLPTQQPIRPPAGPPPVPVTQKPQVILGNTVAPATVSYVLPVSHNNGIQNPAIINQGTNSQVVTSSYGVLTDSQGSGNNPDGSVPDIIYGKGKVNVQPPDIPFSINPAVANSVNVNNVNLNPNNNINNNVNLNSNNNNVQVPAITSFSNVNSNNGAVNNNGVGGGSSGGSFKNIDDDGFAEPELSTDGDGWVPMAITKIMEMFSLPQKGDAGAGQAKDFGAISQVLANSINNNNNNNNGIQTSNGYNGQTINNNNNNGIQTSNRYNGQTINSNTNVNNGGLGNSNNAGNNYGAPPQQLSPNQNGFSISNIGQASGANSNSNTFQSGNSIPANVGAITNSNPVNNYNAPPPQQQNGINSRPIASGNSNNNIIPTSSNKPVTGYGVQVTPLFQQPQPNQNNVNPPTSTGNSNSNGFRSSNNNNNNVRPVSSYGGPPSSNKNGPTTTSLVNLVQDMPRQPTTTTVATTASLKSTEATTMRNLEPDLLTTFPRGFTDTTDADTENAEGVTEVQSLEDLLKMLDVSGAEEEDYEYYEDEDPPYSAKMTTHSDNDDNSPDKLTTAVPDLPELSDRGRSGEQADVGRTAVSVWNVGKDRRVVEPTVGTASSAISNGVDDAPRGGKAVSLFRALADRHEQNEIEKSKHFDSKKEEATKKRPDTRKLNDRVALTLKRLTVPAEKERPRQRPKQRPKAPQTVRIRPIPSKSPVPARKRPAPEATRFSQLDARPQTLKNEIKEGEEEDRKESEPKRPMINGFLAPIRHQSEDAKTDDAVEESSESPDKVTDLHAFVNLAVHDHDTEKDFENFQDQFEHEEDNLAHLDNFFDVVEHGDNWVWKTKDVQKMRPMMLREPEEHPLIEEVFPGEIPEAPTLGKKFPPLGIGITDSPVIWIGDSSPGPGFSTSPEHNGSFEIDLTSPSLTSNTQPRRGKSQSLTSNPEEDSPKRSLSPKLVNFYPIHGKPFKSFIPDVEYASIV